ncbi:MAG: toll/interleukin-1 receptor domain-containing protein, partial [Proteobacteria bacterium]|nr:toll/interleukin-1 receptor domain-containing protein [Pseudomonadota bacterium]
MPTLYDAFISYGHKDSKPFAILLHDELVKQGLSIWLDVDDMPPAIEFQKQIDEIIPKSHNIIFIISPLSVVSEYCGKEIDLAIKCNKRIIPIRYIDPNNWDNMPSILNKFDKIFFWKDKLESGEIDFEEQFALLLSAINRQRDYVERHTSILVDALIWQRNHTQTQYLLIGEKRKEAEEWLQEKDELLPCEPTDLHCEYICASTINANNLLTQVFISYSIEDKEFAVELWHKLMRQHITVWMDDSQTQVAYQTDVKKHIENADNFIYLNSPNSLQSEICKQQKDYAISLHKRVIEYDSEQVDQLIKNLREDAYYYEQHKILLVKALKWEQWGRKATMLL